MIDYTEHEIDGKNVKLYNSLVAHKLSARETASGEDETREEYNLRKVAMNNYKKWAKKQKNMIHVSSVLLPLLVDGNPITDMKGNMVYNKKTKGVTYRKDVHNQEEEHMDLLAHLKQIANEQEEDEQQSGTESGRES